MAPLSGCLAPPTKRASKTKRRGGVAGLGTNGNYEENESRIPRPDTISLGLGGGWTDNVDAVAPLSHA